MCDHLDPARIPSEERFKWQPVEFLVAVLGTHAWKHWGAVYSVAFRSDGRFVASAGDDGVRFWDRNKIGSPVVHFIPQLSMVAFGPHWPSFVGVRPNAQGRWNLQLWDEVTRPTTLYLEWLDVGKISSLAWSGDNRRLAIGCTDGQVYLWTRNMHPAVRPQTLFVNNSGITSLAFSHDGRILAAGCSSGEISLWETWAGGARRTVLPTAHSNGIIDLAFDHNGHKLATVAHGYEDEYVFLWSLEGVQVTSRTPLCIPQNGPPTSVAFSRNGKRLAVGGPDGDVCVFDLSVQEPKITYESSGMVDGSEGDVTPVAFSPDGTLLASGDHFGAVTIQGIDGVERCEAPRPRGHSSPVHGLAFTPNGRLLGSCGVPDDGSVCFWELSGDEAMERNNHHKHRPIVKTWFFRHPLAFSSDGLTLAVGDNSSTELWRCSNGQFRRWATLYAPGDPEPGFELPEDPEPDFELSDLTEVEQGASTSEDASGAVSSGSVATCPVCMRVKVNGLDPLAPADFPVFIQTDRPTLICMFRNVPVRVWDLDTDAPKAACIPHLSGTPVAFSPNGGMVVTGDSATQTDGWEKLVLWDLGSATPVRLLDIGSIADEVLALSPDGSVLLTQAADGRVSLWDAKARKEIGLLWSSPPGKVSTAMFSHDGKHLALGNANGTIYILRREPLNAPPPREPSSTPPFSLEGND